MACEKLLFAEILHAISKKFFVESQKLMTFDIIKELFCLLSMVQTSKYLIIKLIMYKRCRMSLSFGIFRMVLIPLIRHFQPLISCSVAYQSHCRNNSDKNQAIFLERSKNLLIFASVLSFIQLVRVYSQLSFSFEYCF